MALVQSVNDSQRAWRNFFDSGSGKRKDRKVGRPRYNTAQGSPAVVSAHPQWFQPDRGELPIVRQEPQQPS